MLNNAYIYDIDGSEESYWYQKLFSHEQGEQDLAQNPKGGGEAEGKETENEKLNSPRLSVAMSASMWALLHFILHRDMNFSYIKSQLYLQLFFDLQDQMVSKKDLFKPL